MSVNPENDQDGVDKNDSDEVHENTRSSAEGVEEKATGSASGGGEPAAGLIGNGMAVDPRHVGQR